MSIKIPSIATWLAGLTITGLKIKDLDAIKENMQIGDWPCLVPHPVNYVTELTVTPASYGANTTGKTDVTYTLNYRLYFRPVTGSIKFFGPYDELIDMVTLILDTIVNNDAPPLAVDIRPRINAIGGVEDAAGNVYHGCDFALEITEFFEVTA